MAGSRPVRFALIGYGAWGRHHARAIVETADAELVAVCCRSDEGRAHLAEAHPGVPVFADYRDLLAKADFDVGDVVLPSHLHFEVGKAVLESGRHLLMEKPMALTIDECAALIAMAEDRGKMLAIGHELRLSSLWGRVKELLDEGAIGDPLYALIELWRKPYRLGSGGWRYDLTRVGNWVLEEPIHFFDLARWYFTTAGEPVSVFAAANGIRPDQPGLHDNFSAVLNFPGGRYAVISQTLTGWEHHQTVKLTGTAGALWARWSGAMDRTFEPTFSLQLRRGEKLEDVPVTKKSGEVYELVDQIGAVARAVRGQTPPPCTGDDGLWSTRMCLAAHRSLTEGRPVRLAEGA